jgi:predicted ATP-grasp superfamily ATP-dependent carboligase
MGLGPHDAFGALGALTPTYAPMLVDASAARTIDAAGGADAASAGPGLAIDPTVVRRAAAMVAGASTVPAGPTVFDALVLDGGSRQALALVRGLGRMGLSVAVGECFAECRPDLPVLAAGSRYAAESVVMRSFAEDADGFGDDLIAFLTRYPTRLVIPSSDGSCAAVQQRRREIAALGCTVALADDASLRIATDKSLTLALARTLGLDGPRTVIVETIDALPAAIASIGLPMVIKPTVSWSGHSQRHNALMVVDADEARAAVADILSYGVPVLAQEWIGGAREGVTLFTVGTAVHGAFAHEELRTVPALGGASTLRRSIPLSDDLRDASIRLVTAAGLDGLSEVEFRRDDRGRLRLMEINARPAGTLEIAQRCGVDFARMLWERTTGQPVHRTTSYRTGLTMRWLRGELRWLRENARGAGRPGSVSTRAALRTFVTEFWRTPRLDVADVRDPRPLWAELRAIVGSLRAPQADERMDQRMDQDVIDRDPGRSSGRHESGRAEGETR